MKHFTITALTIAALTLVGCSAPASGTGPTAAPSTAAASPLPSASQEPKELPAGAYKLTTESGAAITFTLPTPATDPAVAELEAYRLQVGGAPVTYLVADVDNRKGTERVNMYMVAAFDTKGRQHAFTSVTDAMKTWNTEDTTLYNRGVELHNENIKAAEVAGRRTMILATSDTDLPASFTRVTVSPSGGGSEEEATPAT